MPRLAPVLSALCLALVAACGTAATESAPPGTPPPFRADEKGPPEPVMPSVVEKICKAAPCSGKFARIWVLRKDDRIQRYLHHGDVSACSEPPSVYFDREGHDVGGIGMRPVVSGSEDERRVDVERARLEAGGTPSEAIDCTGRTLGLARP